MKDLHIKLTILEPLSPPSVSSPKHNDEYYLLTLSFLFPGDQNYPWWGGSTLHHIICSCDQITFSKAKVLTLLVQDCRSD